MTGFALFVTTAAAVDIKLCAQINTEFDDAEPDITTAYDDYFKDNAADRPLRGVWVEADDNGVGSTYAGYTADSGADAGCVTFDLVQGHTYTLSLTSGSSVSGQTVIVWDPVAGDYYTEIVTTTYTVPASPETRTHTQNGGREWSLLAVVSWALFHRDAGLPDQTWWVLDDSCPGVGGFCADCDLDGDTNLSYECGGTDNGEPAVIHAGTTSKTWAVHELGHLLALKAAHARGNNSPTAATEDCHRGGTAPPGGWDAGHDYQTKEYTAEALWEGFASSYASVTFNDPAGGDCFLHYYKVQDWDVDGFNDSDAFEDPVNCDDEPMAGLDACVTDFDYLDDSNTGCGCGTGSLFNRGTEYDMVRFVWRAYEDTRFTFGDIVGVLAIAWANGFNGTSDNPTDYQPADAVQDAADDYFALNPDDESAWNDHASDNGLYH